MCDREGDGMRQFFFFLLSGLKKKITWMTCVLVFLLTLFGFAGAAAREPLPGAVFSDEASEEAEAVVTYLDGYSFYVCRSREELLSMVRSGEADSGVILLSGFGEALSEGNLSQSAELVVSDRSQRDSQTRLFAAYAICQAEMSCIAAQTAEEMGYASAGEDLGSYEERTAEEVKRLEFEMVTVDGESAEGSENTDFPVGTLAVGCFTVFGLFCTGSVRRSCRELRIRFCYGPSWFFRCLFMRYAAAGVCVFCAAAAGICVAKILGLSGTLPQMRLLSALFIYIFVLICLFSILSALPVSEYFLVCAIAAEATASLVLCPLYSKTNLMLGVISPLRVFSIPYLLFLLFQL